MIKNVPLDSEFSTDCNDSIKWPSNTSIVYMWYSMKLDLFRYPTLTNPDYSKQVTNELLPDLELRWKTR
jgi:hypothetical protein